MDELKIEKGVPIPPKWKNGNIMDVMRKLKVGDSFVLPPDKCGGIFSRANYLKIKISTRKEGDHTRIWRIK